MLSFKTSVKEPRFLFAAIAAVAIIMGASSTARAQSDSPKSTTALQSVNNQQPEANQSTGIFLTFTPVKKGIGPSPEASFGCSIPYPTATETFASRTATWSGSISCSTAVGLYGTTKFFNYNTNFVYASGTQINTTATSASSSGSYSGVPSGTYEVNFNITITPPAGYTTTPGSGCSYVNGGPQVNCTVGSGTFNQP